MVKQLDKSESDSLRCNGDVVVVLHPEFSGRFVDLATRRSTYIRGK